MIIHLQADDAGIGNHATRMILQAWEEGLLNGFGIVANKECNEQISASLRMNKEIDCTLSAHLNLTDGMALQPYTEGSLIIKPDGRLKIDFVQALIILAKSGRAKRLFLQEVYREWDMQLQFIKQVCGERKLKVINSHNHVHMLPSLFAISAELTKKYGIPQVRVVNEFFFVAKRTDLCKAFFWVNLCKWVVLKVCFYRIKKRKIRYSSLTKEVFGITYSGHITVDAISKAVSSAKRRGVDSLEIFLHPGQSLSSEMDKWASRESAKSFFIDPARNEEMEVLKKIKHEHVFAN